MSTCGCLSAGRYCNRVYCNSSLLKCMHTCSHSHRDPYPPDTILNRPQLSLTVSDDVHPGPAYQTASSSAGSLHQLPHVYTQPQHFPYATFASHQTSYNPNAHVPSQQLVEPLPSFHLPSDQTSRVIDGIPAALRCSHLPLIFEQQQRRD